MEAVINWKGKAFKKMVNLKTLIIKGGNFSKGSQHFPSGLSIRMAKISFRLYTF
jgi:hypothetical protein